MLYEVITPLSQNLYTYAQNNPVGYVDPSGHNPLLFCLIPVVGQATVITSYSIHYTKLYDYDADLRLTKIVDQAGERTFRYDKVRKNDVNVADNVDQIEVTDRVDDEVGLDKVEHRDGVV